MNKINTLLFNTKLVNNNSIMLVIYPWIVWFLSATFFFYKYVLQISPGAMSVELMRDFNITGAGLGSLAACYFYAYLVMQIPVGILLDRFSPRMVTTVAILLCSSGAYIFAQADTLITACIGRAIIGFGASFAAVASFKLATIWFPPNRFAFVAGLYMTTAMLGAIMGAAPIAFLVKLFGWRYTMLLAAIPGFCLAILFYLIVRDKAIAKPLKDPTAANKVFTRLIVVLKKPQSWLLSLYSGLAFAPLSVFGGLWGASFLALNYNITKITAAMSVALIFVGFAIGCPIAGWLSDYIKRRVIIIQIGTLLALVTMCSIIYMQLRLWEVDVLLVLFGFGSSSFFLCFSMIREINKVIFAATALGFMNTFDAICEAVTEPFIGRLLDIGWHGSFSNGTRVFSLPDYHIALMILPLYLLASFLISFFLNETYCQQSQNDI